MGEVIDCTDHDEIRELLIGQKITVREDNVLVLDNGTELTVIANDGCGGCSSGHFYVQALNGVDNAIMSVEFDNTVGQDYDENLVVCVYTEFGPQVIIDVEGDVGNGWYGWGYTIRVKRNKTEGEK